MKSFEPRITRMGTNKSGFLILKFVLFVKFVVGILFFRLVALWVFTMRTRMKKGVTIDFSAPISWH